MKHELLIYLNLKLSSNNKDNKDNKMLVQQPKLLDAVRQRMRYKYMSYRAE